MKLYQQMKIVLLIFALIIMIIGFTLLFLVSWKIGLGITLVVWGNNIAESNN